MLTDLKERLEAVERYNISRQNESIIREQLNILLLKTKLYEMNDVSAEEIYTLKYISLNCRKKLRTLNNYALSQQMICEFSEGDIIYFLEDLCCAADLLISGTGRRLYFEKDSTSYKTLFSPSLIIGALLNLVSNSIEHSIEKETLICSKRFQNGISLEIYNRGKANMDAVSKSFMNKGSGLNAAQNCARLHGGTCFISSSNKSTKAVFSVNIYKDKQKNFSQYIPPDFTEYICDRLSPLYTGLCKSIICPI